jgi:hypothetical protein
MVQPSPNPRPLEVLGKKWPFPTRLVVPSVGTTVGTTSTACLLPNPNRVAWIIINLSVNRGFFYFTPQVATSLGIPIEADGDTWSADLDEDGELVIYPVFGINQVASGVWLPIEIVRVRSRAEVLQEAEASP